MALSSFCSCIDSIVAGAEQLSAQPRLSPKLSEKSLAAALRHREFVDRGYKDPARHGAAIFDGPLGNCPPCCGAQLMSSDALGTAGAVPREVTPEDPSAAVPKPLTPGDCGSGQAGELGVCDVGLSGYLSFPVINKLVLESVDCLLSKESTSRGLRGISSLIQTPYCLRPVYSNAILYEDLECYILRVR